MKARVFYNRGEDQIVGANPMLNGSNDSLFGDTSWIHGTIHPELSGNVSFLKGDISGIHGELSGLTEPYDWDLTSDEIYVPWCLKGDVSRIRGDISNLYGDVSNLYGDVSNLHGNVSRLSGNASLVTKDIAPVTRFIEGDIESGIPGALPRLEEYEAEQKEKYAGFRARYEAEREALCAERQSVKKTPVAYAVSRSPQALLLDQTLREETQRAAVIEPEGFEYMLWAANMGTMEKILAHAKEGVKESV